MCTVSWVHEPDGYQLFCNRDERHTRPRALSPRVGASEGVQFIAPLDAEAGGTWIGCNEFGISVCLLNGSRKPASAPALSRGLLLPELFAASSVVEVAERAWANDLARFAPFVVAALGPGQPATVIDWDGSEKTIVPYGEPYMPLTSSSVDARGVNEVRREEFRRRVAAAGKLDWSVLLDFHESHGARPNAYSPCMHRRDAETVSFSWVRVNEERIEFLYKPSSPCGPALADSRIIARRH
jgi:hypothetical protein